MHRPLDTKSYSLNCDGKLLTLDRPRIMGILNLTPDSFHPGSRITSDQILQKAEQMLEAGADILDIGGQSTRPGAELIDAEQEWQRILKPLTLLKKEYPDSIISIDTFHGAVARSAIQHGASIINDVSAGQIDPDILDAAIELDVPYILMHSPGAPQRMQEMATYEDVMREVFVQLDRWLQKLRRKGLNDIVVDPGFGFGKTADHNWTMLKNLKAFHSLDAPLLVGISRKSMFYRMLNTEPGEVLPATTAAHMYALEAGAHILRVHDVKAAAQAVAVYTRLQAE